MAKTQGEMTAMTTMKTPTLGHQMSGMTVLIQIAQEMMITTKTVMATKRLYGMKTHWPEAAIAKTTMLQCIHKLPINGTMA